MIITHLPFSILRYAKEREPDVLGQEAQQDIQGSTKTVERSF